MSSFGQSPQNHELRQIIQSLTLHINTSFNSLIENEHFALHKSNQLTKQTISNRTNEDSVQQKEETRRRSFFQFFTHAQLLLARILALVRVSRFSLPISSKLRHIDSTCNFYENTIRLPLHNNLGMVAKQLSETRECLWDVAGAVRTIHSGGNFTLPRYFIPNVPQIPISMRKQILQKKHQLISSFLTKLTPQPLLSNLKFFISQGVLVIFYPYQFCIIVEPSLPPMTNFYEKKSILDDLTRTRWFVHKFTFIINTLPFHTYFSSSPTERAQNGKSMKNDEKNNQNDFFSSPSTAQSTSQPKPILISSEIPHSPTNIFLRRLNERLFNTPSTSPDSSSPFESPLASILRTVSRFIHSFALDFIESSLHRQQLRLNVQPLHYKASSTESSTNPKQNFPQGLKKPTHPIGKKGMLSYTAIKHKSIQIYYLGQPPLQHLASTSIISNTHTIPTEFSPNNALSTISVSNFASSTSSSSQNDNNHHYPCLTITVTPYPRFPAQMNTKSNLLQQYNLKLTHTPPLPFFPPILSLHHLDIQNCINFLQQYLSFIKVRAVLVSLSSYSTLNHALLTSASQNHPNTIIAAVGQHNNADCDSFSSFFTPFLSDSKSFSTIPSSHTHKATITTAQQSYPITFSTFGIEKSLITSTSSTHPLDPLHVAAPNHILQDSSTLSLPKNILLAPPPMCVHTPQSQQLFSQLAIQKVLYLKQSTANLSLATPRISVLSNAQMSLSLNGITQHYQANSNTTVPSSLSPLSSSSSSPSSFLNFSPPTHPLTLFILTHPTTNTSHILWWNNLLRSHFNFLYHSDMYNYQNQTPQPHLSKHSSVQSATNNTNRRRSSISSINSTSNTLFNDTGLSKQNIENDITEGKFMNNMFCAQNSPIVNPMDMNFLYYIPTTPLTSKFITTTPITSPPAHVELKIHDFNLTMPDLNSFSALLTQFYSRSTLFNTFSTNEVHNNDEKSAQISTVPFFTLFSALHPTLNTSINAYVPQNDANNSKNESRMDDHNEQQAQYIFQCSNIQLGLPNVLNPTSPMPPSSSSSSSSSSSISGSKSSFSNVNMTLSTPFVPAHVAHAANYDSSNQPSAPNSIHPEFALQSQPLITYTLTTLTINVLDLLHTTLTNSSHSLFFINTSIIFSYLLSLLKTLHRNLLPLSPATPLFTNSFTYNISLTSSTINHFFSHYSSSIIYPPLLISSQPKIAISTPQDSTNQFTPQIIPNIPLFDDFTIYLPLSSFSTTSPPSPSSHLDIYLAIAPTRLAPFSQSNTSLQHLKIANSHNLYPYYLLFTPKNSNHILSVVSLHLFCDQHFNIMVSAQNNSNNQSSFSPQTSLLPIFSALSYELFQQSNSILPSSTITDMLSGLIHFATRAAEFITFLFTLPPPSISFFEISPLFFTPGLQHGRSNPMMEYIDTVTEMNHNNNFLFHHSSKIYAPKYLSLASIFPFSTFSFNISIPTLTISNFSISRKINEQQTPSLDLSHSLSTPSLQCHKFSNFFTITTHSLFTFSTLFSLLEEVETNHINLEHLSAVHSFYNLQKGQNYKKNYFSTLLDVFTSQLPPNYHQSNDNDDIIRFSLPHPSSIGSKKQSVNVDVDQNVNFQQNFQNPHQPLQNPSVLGYNGINSGIHAQYSYSTGTLTLAISTSDSNSTTTPFCSTSPMSTLLTYFTYFFQIANHLQHLFFLNIKMVLEFSQFFTSTPEKNLHSLQPGMILPHSISLTSGITLKLTSNPHTRVPLVFHKYSPFSQQQVHLTPLVTFTTNNLPIAVCATWKTDFSSYIFPHSIKQSSNYTTSFDDYHQLWGSILHPHLYPLHQSTKTSELQHNDHAWTKDDETTLLATIFDTFDEIVNDFQPHDQLLTLSFDMIMQRFDPFTPSSTFTLPTNSFNSIAFSSSSQLNPSTSSILKTHPLLLHLTPLQPDSIFMINPIHYNPQTPSYTLHEELSLSSSTIPPYILSSLYTIPTHLSRMTFLPNIQPILDSYSPHHFSSSSTTSQTYSSTSNYKSISHILCGHILAYFLVRISMVLKIIPQMQLHDKIAPLLPSSLNFQQYKASTPWYFNNQRYQSYISPSSSKPITLSQQQQQQQRSLVHNLPHLTVKTSSTSRLQPQKTHFGNSLSPFNRTNPSNQLSLTKLIIPSLPVGFYIASDRNIAFHTVPHTSNVACIPSITPLLSPANYLPLLSTSSNLALKNPSSAQHGQYTHQDPHHLAHTPTSPLQPHPATSSTTFPLLASNFILLESHSHNLSKNAQPTSISQMLTTADAMYKYAQDEAKQNQVSSHSYNTITDSRVNTTISTINTTNHNASLYTQNNIDNHAQQHQQHQQTSKLFVNPLLPTDTTLIDYAPLGMLSLTTTSLTNTSLCSTLLDTRNLTSLQHNPLFLHLSKLILSQQALPQQRQGQGQVQYRMIKSLMDLSPFSAHYLTHNLDLLLSSNLFTVSPQYFQQLADLLHYEISSQTELLQHHQSIKQPHQPQELKQPQRFSTFSLNFASKGPIWTTFEGSQQIQGSRMGTGYVDPTNKLTLTVDYTSPLTTGTNLLASGIMNTITLPVTYNLDNKQAYLAEQWNQSGQMHNHRRVEYFNHLKMFCNKPQLIAMRSLHNVYLIPHEIHDVYMKSYQIYSRDYEKIEKTIYSVLYQYNKLLVARGGAPGMIVSDTSQDHQQRQYYDTYTNIFKKKIYQHALSAIYNPPSISSTYLNPPSRPYYIPQYYMNEMIQNECERTGKGVLALNSSHISLILRYLFYTNQFSIKPPFIEQYLQSRGGNPGGNDPMAQIFPLPHVLSQNDARQQSQQHFSAIKSLPPLTSSIGTRCFDSLILSPDHYTQQYSLYHHLPFSSTTASLQTQQVTPVHMAPTGKRGSNVRAQQQQFQQQQQQQQQLPQQQGISPLPPTFSQPFFRTAHLHSNTTSPYTPLLPAITQQSVFALNLDKSTSLLLAIDTFRPKCLHHFIREILSQNLVVDFSR